MAEPTVIVADDDAGIRTVISRALSREGYGVQATGTAATLWRWIEDGTGDVAILDVVLPDENALDLLPRIKQRRPGLPVIMMSAQNTLLTAVRATERGAFDYLPKPFDLAQLVTMVKRALALPQKTEIAPEELNRLEEQLPIIGRSAPMQEIYRVVARLVGTDLTVMINGESGTGKELVAKAIHDYGKRRGGPFIAVNMAAIPASWSRASCSVTRRARLPAPMRARWGGSSRPRAAPCSWTRSGTCRSRPRPGCCACCSPASSCRSAAACRSGRSADRRATHRDLRQLVGQGLFREDLFYRLNVVPIRLPPLRERVDDIPALVQHFLNSARLDGLPPKTVEPAAMARLKTYHWPGNVRELENLVRRLTVLYVQDIIGAEVIEAELREGIPAAPRLGRGRTRRWLHRRRRPLRRADLRRTRRPPAAGRPVRPDLARGGAAADRTGAHRDRAAISCGLRRFSA